MSNVAIRDGDRTEFLSRRKAIRIAGLGLVGGALRAGVAAAKRMIELDTQFMAMWSHGTGLQVEFPERLKLISRRSVHTHLVRNPGTQNRIHFAIPTR